MNATAALAALLWALAAYLAWDLYRDLRARRQLRIVLTRHEMVFVRGRRREHLYLTPRTFPPTDFLN